MIVVAITVSRVVALHGCYGNYFRVGFDGMLDCWQHTLSQIISTFVGIHDALFVVTDVDRSDCMHMVLRDLERYS